MVAINTRLIPKPDGRRKVVEKYGVTSDIMEEVVNVYNISRKGLQKFAEQLKGNTERQTAKKIFEFIKANIAYIEDEAGYQFIKTPARIWAEKYADCKGYAIFAGHLLDCLGIPFYFRFASYSSGSKTPTHVYIQTVSGYTIDPVLNKFNEEKKYYYKIDIMAQIERLSGVDNKSGIITVAGQTTTAAIERHIMIERLEIERDILITKARKTGVDVSKAVAAYNGTILTMQREAVDSVINNRVPESAAVGNIFKKIGDAIKKVVQIPFTAPAKLLMEIQLPKAAMGFLYIFIYPEYQGGDKVDLLDKVPDAVRNKAAKAKKMVGFITKLADFKESHTVEKIRSGILKKHGKHPEILIAEKLNISISGSIGAWGAIVGLVIDLVKWIVSLFKKKSSDVPAKAEDFTPDEMGDFEAINIGTYDPKLQEQTGQKSGGTVLEKVLDGVKSAGGALADVLEANKKVKEQGGDEDYYQASYNATDAHEAMPSDKNNNMLLIGSAAVAAYFLLKK